MSWMDPIFQTRKNQNSDIDSDPDPEQFYNTNFCEESQLKHLQQKRKNHSTAADLLFFRTVSQILFTVY
jgi:hypothetical protein